MPEIFFAIKRTLLFIVIDLKSTPYTNTGDLVVIVCRLSFLHSIGPPRFVIVLCKY